MRERETKKRQSFLPSLLCERGFHYSIFFWSIPILPKRQKEEEEEEEEEEAKMTTTFPTMTFPTTAFSTWRYYQKKKKKSLTTTTTFPTTREKTPRSTRRRRQNVVVDGHAKFTNGIVCLIRVEDDDDDDDDGKEEEETTTKRRRSRRRKQSTTRNRREGGDPREVSSASSERRLPDQYDKIESDSKTAAAAKEKMFQILRDSASWDPDVEKLLDGIDATDPDAIEKAIRKRFEEKKSGVYKPLSDDGEGDGGDAALNGSSTPTLVFFRQVQTQNLWVWMEARNTIDDKEKEFFDEAIKSWFVVGKLGGYNVENQQCLENASVLNDTVSHLDYDIARSHDRTNASLFHAIGEVEYRGKWARVWMDLGTADEMALDVLINSLITLSREYVGIKQIVVGGDNENGWGTADSGYGQEQGKQFEDFDPAFDDMFGDMRGMRGKPNEEDSKWMSR